MGTGICVRTPTESDNNNNINEIDDINQIIKNFEYEEYIPIKNNEDDNLNGKDNNNNQKESGNKFNESDIPIDIIKDSTFNNNENPNCNGNENIEENKENKNIEINKENESSNKKNALKSNKKNSNHNTNNNSPNKLSSYECQKLYCKNLFNINMKKNNIHKKIKFPDVFSIVPEKIILESEGNELIFISELQKMININMKERVKYSSRFCMLTKDNFIIYNSKENYITLKKPLAIIPIKEINRIVLFKLSQDSSNFDHFYLCINRNKNTEIIYEQINTFFMNGENINNEQDALIMFKSFDKELIKKWYVIINFLIEYHKKNHKKNNINEKNELQKINENKEVEKSTD